MIEKQKEYAVENKELRERILISGLHISELKSVKESLEEKIQDQTQILKSKDKENQLEKETLRRIAKQFENQLELEKKENSETKKNLQKMKIFLEKIQEKNNCEEEKYEKIQLENKVQKEKISVLENEKKLLEDRNEENEKKNEKENEEIRVLRKRIKITNEQLVKMRKEMKFLNFQIMALQEKVRNYQNKQISEDNVAQPVVVVPDPKKKHKKTKEEVLSEKIEFLLDKVNKLKEAATAHQIHSTFMQSEVLTLFPSSKYPSTPLLLPFYSPSTPLLPPFYSPFTPLLLPYSLCSLFPFPILSSPFSHFSPFSFRLPSSSFLLCRSCIPSSPSLPFPSSPFPSLPFLSCKQLPFEERPNFLYCSLSFPPFPSSYPFGVCCFPPPISYFPSCLFLFLFKFQ